MARGRVTGYVERGGQQVMADLSGTAVKAQRSYPSATVTVKIAGTSTNATIYSNSSGASKSNPFTVDTVGFYDFFTDEDSVDLVFSGSGVPTWTVSGVVPSSTTSSSIINVKDFGAVGDGVTDDTARVQAALDYFLINGGTLSFPHATYKMNSPVTLRRSNAAHSKNWIIQGNGSTLDFTALTGSSVAFTVGATSTSFFVEEGSIHISDLTCKGPEANGAGSGSTNTTTTTGLLLEFAGGVYLENFRAPNFYNSVRTRFAFPVVAIRTQVRNSYIGVWHDESSNWQTWISTNASQCRYGVVIAATTENLDSGKMQDITHHGLHVENTVVGVHIDPGYVSDTGFVRIEQVWIKMPYMANSTYDSIRAGMEFDFANPSVRGANRNNPMTDLRVEDGLWNLTPDADTAAIAFGTNGRVRHAFIDIPVPTLEDNAFTIAGAPGGGSRIILRPRFSGTGKHTEYIYNDTPARSVRRQSSGRTLIGAAKVATGDIATTGLELEENGVIWATAAANPAIRLNRKTSDGDAQTFYREAVAVGSISVTGAATSYNTSSDERLKENIVPAPSAWELVKATPVRSFDWRTTGEHQDFGYVAQELVLLDPLSVHVGSEDESWGVDPSKRVALLERALQEAITRIEALELEKQRDST